MLPHLRDGYTGRSPDPRCAIMAWQQLSDKLSSAEHLPSTRTPAQVDAARPVRALPVRNGHAAPVLEQRQIISANPHHAALGPAGALSKPGGSSTRSIVSQLDTPVKTSFMIGEDQIGSATRRSQMKSTASESRSLVPRDLEGMNRSIVDGIDQIKLTTAVSSSHPTQHPQEPTLATGASLLARASHGDEQLGLRDAGRRRIEEKHISTGQRYRAKMPPRAEYLVSRLQNHTISRMLALELTISQLYRWHGN